MVVGSFSAKRLDTLLNMLDGVDVVGVSTLREIAAFAWAILREVDDQGQRVLAWVLARQLGSICDRYEADAMSVDDSVALLHDVRTILREAILRLSASGNTDPAEIIQHSARVIAMRVVAD